jgi:hypothetical protein
MIVAALLATALILPDRSLTLATAHNQE